MMKAIITPNKEYEYTKSFNNLQKDQIKLAESFGIENSDIKNHPEWSYDFMNIFINRERENKSLDPMYKAAEYLKENRLSCDVKQNQIGCNLECVINLVQAIESGININHIADKKDGVIDSDMWLFNLKTTLMKNNGSDLLLSGRVCLTGDIFQDYLLMSEGIPEAREICNKLSSYNVNSNEENRYNEDPFSSIASRAFDMESILLTLDDMNIRGQQVVDAVEYAGGTVPSLFEILKTGRSKELVDYINAKTADRISRDNNLSGYVAVTDGASFDKIGNSFSFRWNPKVNTYKMDATNYEKYLNNKKKSLETDYLKHDIINDVDTETAIKIAEARGFKILKRFDNGERFGSKCESIMMYSDKTGAIITAPKATKNNFCYDGCYLLMIMKNKPEFNSLSHSASGFIGDYDKNHLFYEEWSYHYGLFKTYDTLSLDKVEDKLFNILADDMLYLPIPEYVFSTNVYANEIVEKTGPELTYLASQMENNLGMYHLTKFINYMLMGNDCELLNGACPAFHPFKEKDFFSSHLINAIGSCFKNELQEKIEIMRIAFNYLHVPEDKIKEYAEGIRNSLAKEDEGTKERKTFFQIPNTYVEIFDSCKHILYEGFDKEDLFLEALNLPPVESLAISLPWLDNENDLGKEM